MKTILICVIDQAFMSVTFRNTQTSLDVSEHHKNHLMITTIYIYYYSFGTYLQKIYYWPKQSTRMDKKASSRTSAGALPPAAATACFSAASMTATPPGARTPSPQQDSRAPLVRPSHPDRAVDARRALAPSEATELNSAGAPPARTILSRSSVQISIRPDIAVTRDQ